MKKALVTYFSCGGTTQEAGEKIATVMNYDVAEIEPEEAYSREDLNWKDKESRSSVEMQDESARPAYKDLDKDLEEYDLIFIGFPIWWGIEPRIIDHFLEKENLKDKVLIPFVTSGGSQIDQAQARLEENYGGKLQFLEGRRWGRNIEAEEIKTWIDDLEI